MQWAAAHGPRLALDHVLQGLGPEAEDLRIALCDGQRILLCTRGALAAGVQPGQRQASALTLAHDLQLIEHDPLQAQQAHTHWCLRWAAACASLAAPKP
jgi:hypothetical protein